jgi:cytochrome bd-type quinol oxidase subunit 1
VVSSILPVFWAFMVAFAAVVVYAIIGQSTFGEEFPQYFRTLGNVQSLLITYNAHAR